MVSTIIHGKLNQLLAEVEDAVLKYRHSHDVEDITILEKHLEDFFGIDDVSLWLYSSSEKNIQSLKRKKMLLPLRDKSLMQESIRTKKPCIENYLRSHKYYNARIDNPYNKSLKSALFYPVVSDEDIIGVVVFSVSQYNQRTFMLEDISVLERFNRFFIVLLQAYATDVVMRLENKQQKENKSKEHTSSLLSANEIALGNKNRVLEENIVSLEEEIKQLLRENQEQKTKLKTLENYNSMSQKHITYLEKKIQNIENEDESKIALQGSLLYDKEHNNNLNLLIMQALPEMQNFEHIFMLYEFIFYESQASSMRIKEIDDTVGKSRLLQTLLKKDTYKYPIPPHVTTVPVQLWIQDLERYQEHLEKKAVILEIEVASNMPVTLRCDGEKLSSICFHLLHDLLLFIDTQKEVKLFIEYREHRLFVDMRGKVLTQKGFFSGKKFTTAKNRLAVMMAKKLIDALEAHLKSYTLHDENIYQLTLPVEVD